MGYFGGSAPGNDEAWELAEGQFISRTLGALSHRHKMAILLSVGLVTAIEISNRLSINVLLPDMQGNVGANSDEISWVVTLYNLGFLCSLALGTWMTRVIGARKHLLYSIGFYSVGAIGCALSAHSLSSLLVSRLIMGFGGGAFLVRVVILSGLMFPGKERLKALTWLYIVLGSFEIVYPVAMGWIDDTFHWNYAFLLDFPFLAIGALLIWKLIPPGYLFRRPSDKQVDYLGAILLLGFLSCLQIAISRGERDLWFESSWIGPTLLVAAVCLVAFLWWDSRIENTAPVFHLRTIWRHNSLRASLSVIAVVGALFGAGLYVAPQYLRFVQDYSATQTGGFISMYTAGLTAGLLFAVWVLAPRLGGPLTASAGLSLMVVTCASIIYICTPTTPTYIIVPALFLQGFALGPSIVGVGRIATGDSPGAELNDLSTSYFFVRQLGNTIGVTAATVLFDHRMNLHSERLLDVANRFDPIVRSTLSQYANLIHRDGGGSSDPQLGALQLFQSDVITQSRLLAYIDIYFGLAAISLLALILLARAQIKPKSGPHHFLFW
jgi:MFS transporter, DHA2 family, multidrug resistance protein